MEEKIIHTFWENKRRYGSRRIVKAAFNRNRISRYKAGKCSENGLTAINPAALYLRLRTVAMLIPLANLLLTETGKPDEVWVEIYLYPPGWWEMGLSGCLDGPVFQKDHWLAPGLPYAGIVDTTAFRRLGTANQARPYCSFRQRWSMPATTSKTD